MYFICLYIVYFLLRINLFLTNSGRDYIRTSQFHICVTFWDKLCYKEVKSSCLIKLQVIQVSRGMKGDSMHS
jgi:hypothetical protein